MKHPAEVLGLLKNNLVGRKKEAVVPFSLLAESLMHKLIDKGYINYVYVDHDIRLHKTVKVLRVGLKYDSLGHNSLLLAYVRSSAGRRNYVRYSSLIHLDKNKKHLFLTPKGYLWLDELKKRHMGGEYILLID